MSEWHPAETPSRPLLHCSNPSCGAWIGGEVQQCPSCGTLQQGFLLNSRFRIEALLGHGGMGAVYRATDLALERVVALKVFAPGAAGESHPPEALRARFFREARLAAQLDHPNIVPVLHFEMDGPLAYLVMPLLTGGTLASTLRRRQPVAPPVVLGWLRQMAAALDYAHRRTPPIIHRDVKPSNLLFHEDGRLCLADFGIARALGGDPFETAPLTRPGVVLGSAAYIAPEQIYGQAVPASDQYSTGVVLYEALTGARPFEAADPRALLFHHLGGTPLPPSHLADGIPPAVDHVVLRALAKDPAQRFPTVGALADAFGTPSLVERRAPYPVPAGDPRGEQPTEAATGLRFRLDQVPPGARAPGPAPGGPSRALPRRQPRHWLLALSAGLALLLVGVLVLLGVGHRGATANQHSGSGPTPEPTLRTNTYVQTLRAAEGHPALFQDALQDNSQRWDLAHGAYFEEDGLHLPSQAEGGDLAEKGQNATAQQTHLALPSSCAVEVDVLVSDPSSSYGFGFLASDRAGHLLTFSASGGYAIFLLAPEHPLAPQQLISGTTAGLALRRGQAVHLAILIQGNQLAFFLNQQFLTSVLLRSDTFTSTRIFSLLNLSPSKRSGGEALSPSDQPVGEIVFEHLKIYPV